MSPDFTRREFLKTLGIIGLTGALGGLVARAAEAAGPKLGEVLQGSMPISLTINGQLRRLQVEPRTTLLSALRHHLVPPLTGTKQVCDQGSCGACTVLLDGRPVNSCLLLALDAVGRSVTTIEGLAAADGTLHPIQQAFVDHDGVMCGFCTPGFVMSVKGLLDHNPHPTAAEIQRACAGNFCRCGCYPKIFEAAQAAARG